MAAATAQRRDLARQIEEAQRRLGAASKRYAGTAQAETYDIAQQLLEISRLRLLGNASVDEEKARALMADAMNRVQARLDAMRVTARRSSQPEQMSARIDALQERLDLARRRFAEEDPGRQPAEPGIERVERLYDIAQQKLNEAYARAAEMPEAGHLIDRLDAAQRRLNQARADFEARTAPDVN